MNKERYSKYADIIARATVMGCMEKTDGCSTMMDIESADRKFNLRLDDWLTANNFDFVHDFLGIRNNINRGSGFPATDFGFLFHDLPERKEKRRKTWKSIILHSEVGRSFLTRTHI